MESWVAAVSGLALSGATDMHPTIILGHVPPLCFFSRVVSIVMQSEAETGSKGKEAGGFVDATCAGGSDNRAKDVSLRRAVVFEVAAVPGVNLRQITQGISQIADCPVPLPPEVITQSPGEGEESHFLPEPHTCLKASSSSLATTLSEEVFFSRASAASSSVCNLSSSLITWSLSLMMRRYSLNTESLSSLNFSQSLVAFSCRFL
ncbi:hypothetical protein EYF80_011282 [Liparis tanakae]|uniref:Uncharacterized protein n=1 Tax=Liparis tanakae TaxID=230148 RepID=A0A4Z2IKH1_9TELE|nr:hypothetical protein EYF80_011282 [Liparis tanakae]